MSMDEEKKPEYAIADNVRILETNLLHASDVIYWVDGSSAESSTQMSRIEIPLDISFSNRPRDLSVLYGAGKTALWRRPTTEVVDGEATQAQRARPAQSPFNLAGEAWDSSRRFNPMTFDLTLGSGNGHAVVVYPTPLGTRTPPGGALFGTVLIESTQAPVIWGLMELVITISTTETLTVRAQTDANGDFVLALKRLPPLPDSIPEYAAQLTLSTDSANNAETAPDLSGYSAVQLESLTTAGSFGSTLALTLRPGERSRVNSAGKNYLAIA